MEYNLKSSHLDVARHVTCPNNLKAEEGKGKGGGKGSEGKEKGILDCKPPIKCHLIRLGKTSAFSINSCA